MHRQFSALRGLAILIVVLHHSILMGTLGPKGLGYPPVQGVGHYILLVLLQLGVFAVPAFLFISGGFVAYAARGNSPRMPWKVVWSGLKRILWPYLIWSVLFYLAVWLQKDETYTLLGYAKNLAIGYPFHFVPLLIFYYALSPVLVWAAKRLGWVVIAVIALYQLVLMNIAFPDSLGFTFPAWTEALVPPILGQTMAQWGVYFPLGLLCSLNTVTILPWLQRFRWVFLAATAAFFVLSLLHAASVLQFPLAAHVCPLTFLLLSLVIKRNSIPMVRRLEEVGKRSYGLYLTHLLVLDLAFLVIQAVLPWVLGLQILLHPLLFALAVGVPVLAMSGLAHLFSRAVYRHVFG